MDGGNDVITPMNWFDATRSAKKFRDAMKPFLVPVCNEYVPISGLCIHLCRGDISEFFALCRQRINPRLLKNGL